MSQSRFAGHSGASVLSQIAFVAYLVIVFALTLVKGSVDVYALAGIAVVVPYILLIWYELKKQPFAFLVSSLLGVLLLAGTVASVTPATAHLDIALANLTAVLLVLIFVESFVAYSELKK